MNKINIKSIQDNLIRIEKENNKKMFYSLDFKGELWLIVTKDEIYVKNWNPTCPSIPNLKLWDSILAEKFDDSTYIHFDDYLDEELNDIVLSMVKECKYSERKFGE